MNPELGTSASCLLHVARRLVWWQPPEEALRDVDRFVAQVMNYGTWDDIRVVQACFGEDRFAEVLAHAPPGLFTARRWNYWHVRLGIAPVPALPTRFEA